MNKKTIEILNVLFLQGPNFWTYRPALEAWLDIGDLEDCPSNTIPGFYERLTAFLPGLIEHHCGVGERGGFLERLREGTWPAHIMEHVMIELQNLAGVQTGFGKARETSTRGVYKLVVRARHERVSRAALVMARDLVMAAIESRPFDVNAAVAQLREILDSVSLGPSTACIVDAATERRIPSIRLNDGNLVQLGYGIRQRRIWTAETDRTSAIAQSISGDKDLTKSLLQSCGLPVPEGRIAASPEDAWSASQEIGLPVVIKPTDGNHGRGVSIDLGTQKEIEAAWALADAEGSEVIVERFVPGNEHRLLVVGGRVVAAARGETAQVVGDGVSTVRQLIDKQINTDPRRGTTEEFPLNLVLLDEDPAVRLELERQGWSAESIPPEGKSVLIQRNGNVAFDVTDLVHPKVAAAVALAARIVDLDIAGIDLVAEDISRPLEEQDGAIVEINAGPGLLMHLKPANGPGQPVGAAIAEHLFPAGENGRIPIVGVTGSYGKTMTARLIAHLLHLNGSNVGLACSDGVYLRERLVNAADSANSHAARRILMNCMVESAVFENGARAILSEGLAYDRCQVGVVINIDPKESLREFHIDDADQMAKVMRTQVDLVLPEGAAVLNADDARVAELASLCDGEVIFFAAAAENPVLSRHRAAGGKTVFVRNGAIMLGQGTQENPIMKLAEISGASCVCHPGTLQNILAAIGAGWALGVDADLMQAGIEAFDYNPRLAA